MIRGRTLAAGLAAVCVAASGCGVSSAEVKKPRPPSGQGETRGSDVSVEQVDDLRSSSVVVNRGTFQPRQVSVTLDSTVRIVNGDEKTVRVRALEGLAKTLEDTKLQPGDEIEVEFLESGTERIGLVGSKAQLEINVWPTG
jgi:hypothetical protein